MANNSIYTQYENALLTLCRRVLAEPYNFYRVDAEIMPAMLGESFTGKAIAACQKAYRAENRYSIHNIAPTLKTTAEELAKMAQQDAEIDLPTAFDFFRVIYAQFVEFQIAEAVPSWIMQGKTAEEIKIAAEKFRGEKGAKPRPVGSDGKAEFEAELLAALDGKVYEYPVKPHLSKLRQFISHFEPGDYIVVGALTGIGKSYFAYNTVFYNAMNGVPCTIINLENTPKNVEKRMWQLAAGRQFRRDLRGSDQETAEAIAALERMRQLKYRSCNPGRDLPAILSTIRHEWNERGIQFAAIDYAQLVKIPGYRGARNYELGEISGAFRALSLELQIPIMALVQFRQDVTRYADKRGDKYDIKDCSDFAQDATFVFSLYRPVELGVEFGPDGNEYSKDYADVTVCKGRETGRAIAACKFSPVHGLYDELPTFDTGNLVDFSAPARVEPEMLPF